ncbi:hypothetical protein [Kamptonema formosum]|uniref:hypothetical protein n=1 Tax=Kamptonema formosum TaxID=331992 RepID=UPI000344CAF5|nr:hypothetical protein [Oscillatoria sp. PCC 10802]
MAVLRSPASGSPALFPFPPASPALSAGCARRQDGLQSSESFLVPALGATASPADEVHPLQNSPVSAREGLRREHRHPSGVACGAQNPAPNPTPACGEGARICRAGAPRISEFLR